jgi:hypothetical protein
MTVVSLFIGQSSIDFGGTLADKNTWFLSTSTPVNWRKA